MKKLLSALALAALIPIGFGYAGTKVGPKAGAGYQIGSGPTEKVGFWGASPTPQPHATAQAALVPGASATVSPVAIATTGATNSTPYGYTTSAQADALVAQVNLLTTKVNQLVTDNNANVVLINQLRADLVATGFIKGGP
jgi:hypothetical protein